MKQELTKYKCDQCMHEEIIQERSFGTGFGFLTKWVFVERMNGHRLHFCSDKCCSEFMNTINSVKDKI